MSGWFSLECMSRTILQTGFLCIVFTYRTNNSEWLKLHSWRADRNVNPACHIQHFHFSIWPPIMCLYTRCVSTSNHSQIIWRVKPVFVLNVRTSSNLSCVLQWATVTQTWWRREHSRWNSSTPTHVSCMTTLCCTPRGCRPHCPTSSPCATLSTLGMHVLALLKQQTHH